MASSKGKSEAVEVLVKFGAKVDIPADVRGLVVCGNVSDRYIYCDSKGHHPMERTGVWALGVGSIAQRTPERGRGIEHSSYVQFSFIINHFYTHEHTWGRRCSHDSSWHCIILLLW